MKYFKVLVETEQDAEYMSADGHSMKREFGKTPNGNELANRWVLRDSNHRMIGFDTFRLDLATRHDYIIQYTGE